MSAGSGIIWRTLEADAQAGGFAIPRGATVVAPIGCIHHDPAHWPEPEKFSPGRFLEGAPPAPAPASPMPHRADSAMSHSHHDAACQERGLI